MVPCVTPWGRWYQTLEEVFIEVRVPPGTRAKDVRCSLRSRHIALAVGGQELLQVPRAAGRRPVRRVGRGAPGGHGFSWVIKYLRSPSPARDRALCQPAAGFL